MTDFAGVEAVNTCDDDLPEEVYEAARAAGLAIEGNEVLHTYCPTDQLCTDYWLTARSGEGIRLEVRVLYREDPVNGTWEPALEGRRSTPISVSAAVALIESWSQQQRLVLRLRNDALLRTTEWDMQGAPRAGMPHHA